MIQFFFVQVALVIINGIALAIFGIDKWKSKKAVGGFLNIGF
jgi:uncharacterized membrane protein YsdA (DUF1294 family)